MSIGKNFRLRTYGLLLLTAIPLAALGSGSGGHGGSTAPSSGGGGGNGSGGGNGGGGGGVTTPPVCSTVLPAGQPSTIVPGTVLIRDTFGLGPQLARPHGGDGRPRQTLQADISGFWAEQPCSNTVIWMGPSLAGVPPWILLGLSPTVGGVGVHHSEPLVENPVALVPFQPPSISYEVSVDTGIAGFPGSWFDVGLTSSNALTNNFESVGQAWMRVKYTADPPFIATVELHTNGLSGPSLSATIPSVEDGPSSSLDTLTVRYDPAAQLVTGYFDGTIIGTISYDASSTRFAGFEGGSTADNFVVKASE